MKYTPEILDRLHIELTEILSEILRVCQKCGIEYFIQGGTAIGALFYGEIIPWDDDIDLGMTRENYLKFLEVAPLELRPEYALQEFTSEPATPFYFAKVRKRGTLFVEHPYEEAPIEQGIYVDIFPFDRIPDNTLCERVHRYEAQFWINCFEGKTQWLWRWFAPTKVDDPLPKGRLACAAVRLVTSLLSKKQIYKVMNRTLGRYNRRSVKRVNIVRMPLDQIDRRTIESPVDMQFCGLTVKAPAEVERYLRHHYKGLQKDIPPEKQVNHAPVVLSFGGEKSTRRISVVIPLYNKADEIGRALRSVERQTFEPLEVIVVDDGSTDCSRQRAEAFGGKNIRIISQPNSGVSAARNRGIAESTGDFVALLDADDYWDADFLDRIDNAIERFPSAAIYSAAFRIAADDGVVESNSPETEGPIEDFWREAIRHRICNSSNSVLPRRVFDKVGGFPEGMRLGEDQYMWIKAATFGAVCFVAKPCVTVSATASNRSEAIYKPETTAYTFEELYIAEGPKERNEFLARCAIGKAITLSAKGDTAFGLRTERFFGYTRLCRRGLRRLKIINRLPVKVRPTVHAFYKQLAWILVRRGE